MVPASEWTAPEGKLDAEVVGGVERIEEIVVSLPFVTPFATSAATWTCKEALLLKVEAEGVVAWGECVADPDPYYAPETVTTVHHMVRDFLLPLLKPQVTLGELARRFARVRGHRMAKAVVENALLDLMAKRRGVPLHELLGFPRKRIPSGISLGLMDSPEALVAAVAQAVARGYHRVKMKISPGKDLAYVRAVREAFPNLRLMVDANGAYRLEDAPLLAELDAFDLMMIEQPLSYSDIYQHSLLQRRLATPLCLDESILSLEDAQAAVALGACRVLNIKQGRVGGLQEAVRIARFAAQQGVPAWSGGMDETGIGRAVNIHLQTAEGFTVPGDTSETSRYFHEDIVEPPVVLAADGFIEVPEGPGIGVTVLADRLAAATIHRERLA
jgi:O-succinylbenzoate synthase